VACVALLRRRREAGMLVLGALALSSLAYQAGLWFASGVQYRLEVPSVAIGLILLVSCTKLMIDRRLQRPC
jgi:hypothetical protein